MRTISVLSLLCVLGCQAESPNSATSDTTKGGIKKTKETHENGAAQEMPQLDIVEWKHGWRTWNVIATRYENPYLGYNIGFRFPENTYNYDHPSVFEWFRRYDGTAIGGGGRPGGEITVLFSGVKDKDSANKKLKEILPELSQFMQTVN